MSWNLQKQSRNIFLIFEFVYDNLGVDRNIWGFPGSEDVRRFVLLVEKIRAISSGGYEHSAE